MGEDALLLSSLEEFYSRGDYGEKLYEVVSGGRRISLRSIDWFITNYSKKNNVYYIVHELEDGTPTDNEALSTKSRNFNVHQSYKSQLKAYSKKSFDPFCRRRRLLFPLNENKHINTTIGQLNFFRWAISNRVTDYIHENKSVIEEDMNTCLKKIKLKSSQKKGERKKREELSLSATRGLSCTNISVELTFD
jgi:hypothetical protein